MKKKLCNMIFLCCLVLCTLCACGKQQIGTNTEEGTAADTDEENSASATFIAKVVKLDDLTIFVEPIEGSRELNSADKISIPNEGNIDLHIGDEIEIEYNGVIMESYPAQLQEVYSIKVVKEAEDSIPTIPPPTEKMRFYMTIF